MLSGAVAQLVDQLARNRNELGISHVVGRGPEAFAPVRGAFAGR